jgi:hypothetical protein
VAKLAEIEIPKCLKVGLTVAFVEATHYLVSTVLGARHWLLLRGRRNPLVCLVHVLDIAFEKEKVRR